MKVLAVPCLNPENPENLKDVFIFPDSSIQYTGRPFFIPDTQNAPGIAVGHILRVGKVGKPSSPKFAGRYYDAWSIAVNFTDTKFACEGFSPSFSRAFQNSLSVGEFLRIGENGCELPAADINFGGQGLTLPPQPDITAVNRLVYALGQRFSLRTGDMIIPGFNYTGLTAECDIRVSCRFDDQLLLSFNIK